MHPRTPNIPPFTRPFTRSEAIAAGIGVGAIRALEQRGVITRMQRGLYVPAGATEILPAALKLLPLEFVVGFEAAASMHRLPVPSPKPLQEVDAYAIGKITRSTTENRLLRFHYEELADEQITTLDDRRVTTIARTAIDVTCRATRLTSLVSLDGALRRGASYDELWAARRCRNGFRGAAKLNWAIVNASSLAESAVESISRAAMLIAGVPTPELQQRVTGENGVDYFADFFWGEKNLIGESDGAVKYSNPAALFSEKRREDALRAAGYGFVRWSWADVYPDPTRMLARLRRALH